LDAGLAGVQLVVDDQGCVVIEASGEAPRHAIVWPHGYWAEADPLRIHDKSGAIVAGEGELLQVWGDFVTEGYPAETCGGEDIWYLSSIEPFVPEQ
jgi:elongation factor P hydroxylase